MSKVKIKLVTVGQLPPHLDLSQVSTWRSDAFELVGNIENFALIGNAVGEDWHFSDEGLRRQLPAHVSADFILAIVNVPIEDNWYLRRLGNNQIVFTFKHIREFLEFENIPLENAVLRVLYVSTLVYLRSGNTIPGLREAPVFTHDDTRGCLFDMNGIKSDLVESCNKPVVCEECVGRLKKERVSAQTIKIAQVEIRKIRKRLYYRIFDFVKLKPLVVLATSSLFAMLIGIAGSIIASYIYDGLKLPQSIQKPSSAQNREPLQHGRAGAV